MICNRPNLVFPILFCALLGTTNSSKPHSSCAALLIPLQERASAPRVVDDSHLYCIKPVVPHARHVQGRRVLRHPRWNAWQRITALQTSLSQASLVGNSYPGNEHPPLLRVFTPLRC